MVKRKRRELQFVGLPFYSSVAAGASAAVTGMTYKFATDAMNNFSKKLNRDFARGVVDVTYQKGGEVHALLTGTKTEEQEEREHAKALMESGLIWFYYGQMSEPLRRKLRYSRKPQKKLLYLAERGLKHEKCKKRPRHDKEETYEGIAHHEVVKKRRKHLSKRDKTLENFYGKH
jgi:hypothetical protein